MNRRSAIGPRSVAGLALGLALLTLDAPASAQYAPQAPRSTYVGRTYQPAGPRYYRQVAPAPAHRGARGQYGLPYNRSPYTDDWSTGRHLPYPKPWMLPTRDPAYRGG